jgi:hypothetical protein
MYDVVRAILADALRGTWDQMALINVDHPQTDRDWATCVRDAWIRSLRRSFQTRYPAEAGFAVFGGRPSENQAEAFGIPGWMWEFLHDIAVVEVGSTPAAYQPPEVAFIKRAIWQVESEVAGDGTEVAKDLSKLRVGAADHKLLLARQATQHDPQPWLDFIGRLCVGMTGDVFLGLMPTYSTEHPLEAQQWRGCTATITLYHSSGFRPVPGGPITAG